MRKALQKRLQTKVVIIALVGSAALAVEAGAEWYAASQLNAVEVDISLLQDAATVKQLDSNGCALDVRLTPIPYQGLRQGRGQIAIAGKGTCNPLTAPFTFTSDYTFEATNANAANFIGTLTLNNATLQLPGDGMLTGSIVMKNVPTKPSAIWLASAITKADVTTTNPPAKLIPPAWRSKVPDITRDQAYQLTFQGQVPIGIVGLYYPPGLNIQAKN